jgi:hypothetical protein
VAKAVKIGVDSEKFLSLGRGYQAIGKTFKMIQKDLKSILVFYMQMILLWYLAILLFMFFRYFGYMDVLNAKSSYYLREYGVQPMFKAGVHSGKVIVAEVGLVKA